jgi:hypothetical protein
VRFQVSHACETTGKIYGFVYFNLHIPGQQVGIQKTLNRMVASISWIYSALNLFMHAILIC